MTLHVNVYTVVVYVCVHGTRLVCTLVHVDREDHSGTRPEIHIVTCPIDAYARYRRSACSGCVHRDVTVGHLLEVSIG